MKYKEVFFNPFRMLSPKLDSESVRLDELYKAPVSEAISLEHGLLTMISKLIEITRLLHKSLFSGSSSQMDDCERMAQEVHEQERILTTTVFSSGAKGALFKGTIRFPYRLERVGDLLESILKCSRVKARDGIPFSDKAHGELDHIFGLLGQMLTNLRDAFITPNKTLLESTLVDTKKMYQMLADARVGHWERMEAGYCAVAAGPVFLDILDSVKSTNEYIEKMSRTLLELRETAAAESGEKD